jgi:hypothetical protein
LSDHHPIIAFPITEANGCVHGAKL